ncbi:transmembrane protein, putative (macronuclear) [Tetrahymena thermophila SB210]|uniref:Transmembrane protein, putative n=1 Tax=Tetrahymena thermophila (strain SB210) TaxID=312017 RepID=Q24GD8_TETTS|nr:transmembrane protein, putative [Tetrahymena thermophila SB210]EAS06792.2 transmembrane protein, putative [Tetrahymena thermophila SB210]|eukprot:XP_001027034.2 transmembrane protein, putative [Tetrahymena thermophila SB210]
MTNFFSQTYVKHFIWTQIQASIAFILITYFVISGTDIAWQICNWIPVLFFYMLLQFILIWYPKRDLTFVFNACNYLILISCLPTFVYYYFIILLPSSEFKSLEFKQVENCVVSGITKTSLDGNEAYSLTYINFEQNGVSYLGSGCLTNQYQAYSLNPIPPYKTLKMNETFECGPGVVDYPKGNPFNNTNVTDIYHRFRLLRGGGSGGHGGGSGGHGGGGGVHGGGSHFGGGYRGCSSHYSSIEEYFKNRPSNRVHSYDPVYGNRYHPYPYYGKDIDSNCKQQFTFSQVKLPTWLCSDENSNFKDLVTPRTCWVHYYNQKKGQAQQNAQSRLNQRQLQELAFITFEYPLYYPKKSFNFIIVFIYFPLILTINSIFQYTSNVIVLKLHNQDNQAETDNINQQREVNNKNSIEMLLINQQ